MVVLDAQIILSALGLSFLLMCSWQWWRLGRLPPKARAWLLLGLIFIAVALWLWWLRGSR